MSESETALLTEIRDLLTEQRDGEVLELSAQAPQPLFAFDWSTILKLLLPIAATIFAPMIVQWLNSMFPNVSIDVNLITELINSLITMIFPSAALLGVGYLGYRGAQNYNASRENMAYAAMETAKMNLEAAKLSSAA